MSFHHRASDLHPLKSSPFLSPTLSLVSILYLNPLSLSCSLSPSHVHNPLPFSQGKFSALNKVVSCPPAHLPVDHTHSSLWAPLRPQPAASYGTSHPQVKPSVVTQGVPAHSFWVDIPIFPIFLIFPIFHLKFRILFLTTLSLSCISKSKTSGLKVSPPT